MPPPQVLRVLFTRILGPVASCPSGLPQMVGYRLQGYLDQWRPSQVAYLRRQGIIYKDIGTGGAQPKWLISDGRVLSTRILGPVASCPNGLPQTAGYYLQGFWDRWRPSQVAYLRRQGIVYKEIGTNDVLPKWLTLDGIVSSTKILGPVASGQSSPQTAGYGLQRYWDQWRPAQVAHLRW